MHVVAYVVAITFQIGNQIHHALNVEITHLENIVLISRREYKLNSNKLLETEEAWEGHPDTYMGIKDEAPEYNYGGKLA